MQFKNGQKERNIHADRSRKRKIDRQIKGYTKQKDLEREREREWSVCEKERGERDRESERETGRETKRETDRNRDKERDRQNWKDFLECCKTAMRLKHTHM